MECVDQGTRVLSRTSETNPAHASGSLSKTQRSPEHPPLRMVSVRLEDCRHKLGPDGVCVVQEPQRHYYGADDDDDEDDDNGGDDDDGDYIPDKKQIRHSTRERGSFSSSMKRKTHKDQTASGAGTFSCDKCRKAFSQLNHLKLHERTHKKKLSVRSAGEFARKTEAKSRQGASFSCEQCSKTYTQLNHLKLHQRSHNKGAEKDKKKSGQVNKSNSCDLCGKVFSSQAYISVHKRIHTGEKRYSCGVCGKAFTQASARTVHQRKHEDGKPSVKVGRRRSRKKKRGGRPSNEGEGEGKEEGGEGGEESRRTESCESSPPLPDAETPEHVENGDKCSLDNAVSQPEDAVE
ncbi:hypothetical protein ACEWY4_017728 [Coilia grayii]|uniref:C2H2-type domain-containing protein n=1 Tax=Coilia grayii TaxID=363190 RepID=A0ABD1JHW6_9TELE